MTNIRSIVYAACLITSLALTSRPASAGILCNTLGSGCTTLGPGNAYDGTNGYFVDGSTFHNQVIANSFTLGAGATVGDAMLALGNKAGGNNPVNVYIESDSGGEPGSILASLSQVGTIPLWSNGSGGGLVTFTCSGAACTLGAGSYWLVAWEPDANTQQVWDFAYLDLPLVIFAYNTLGSPTGPWITDAPVTDAAFQIDGPNNTTPEPGSLILLGSGLLGLAGVVRRRRNF